MWCYVKLWPNFMFVSMWSTNSREMSTGVKNMKLFCLSRGAISSHEWQKSAHQMRSTLRDQELDYPPKDANLSLVSPKIGIEKSLKRSKVRRSQVWLELAPSENCKPLNCINQPVVVNNSLFLVCRITLQLQPQIGNFEMELELEWDKFKSGHTYLIKMHIYFQLSHS